MDQYILSVDQSTQSTKVFLFEKNGTCLAKSIAVHKQYYPEDGWVEQDAEEIYELVCQGIRKVIWQNGAEPEKIAALAITTQTGAFALWDRKTGKPVYHMIGWQCSRGEKIVNELSEQQADLIKRKTFSSPQGYLVAAKLSWVMRNIPELRQKAFAGDILFGTVESYLIYRLTEGETHAGDYGNAGYTQLLNMETLCWDKKLLECFGIPDNILPELKESDGDFGRMKMEGLPDIPITGVMGDSAASLFGQGGAGKGSVKITYGTGASLLMNVGSCVRRPPDLILPSIGWKRKGENPTYLWEGTAMYTGEVIEWLVEGLQILPDAFSSEAEAEKVPDNGGVYLVPAFQGMIVPEVCPQARTMITGMNRQATKSHIVRAALESTAFQIGDFISKMAEMSHEKITEILADGGGSKNRFLMQFQADILGIPLICNEREEGSAFGAACMAGIAVGIYKSCEDILNMRKQKERFFPDMSEEKRKKLVQGWKAAQKQAMLYRES